MKRQMPRREDYLKLIYPLSKKGEVLGADLTGELDVKRPTVCVYLKRLVKTGDITMDAHHCIRLTEQGSAIAESTLDRIASGSWCAACGRYRGWLCYRTQHQP